MLPLPRTIPLAHADELLDPDGSLVAESRFAKVVAQILPYLLRELVHYAAALVPCVRRWLPGRNRGAIWAPAAART
jgi:hypothetical protein